MDLIACVVTFKTFSVYLVNEEHLDCIDYKRATFSRVFKASFKLLFEIDQTYKSTVWEKTTYSLVTGLNYKKALNAQ